MTVLVIALPSLLLIGAVVGGLVPDGYDWRLRSRLVVLRRSERGLGREVARILQARGFSELTILTAGDGSIGLIARGSGRSLRLRTVRRRVVGRCSYCVIEGLVRGLPTEALGGDRAVARRVVNDYRRELASQPNAVRIYLNHGLDRSLVANSYASSAPRYEPDGCPVHSPTTPGRLPRT